MSVNTTSNVSSSIITIPEWEQLVQQNAIPKLFSFYPYSFDRIGRKIYMINAKDNWFYSFDIGNLRFNSITASGYHLIVLEI